MSSSAGVCSTSPSPSSSLCRGASVHSSRTRPVHVTYSHHTSSYITDITGSRSILSCEVILFPDVVAECEKSSATTYYWYRKALDISDNISDGGGLNWKMTLCLLAAWTIVCLAMIKGIQSSGKVRRIHLLASFSSVDSSSLRTKWFQSFSNVSGWVLLPERTWN